MPSTDNFIEQLNDVPSLRGFMALSCQQLAKRIEQLIERVFRKADFALKSVVDSLFEHQGPLAELPVRLKVLLGLGVLSAESFQDISQFLKFKQLLSDEVEELPFTHPSVLAFAKSLHHLDFSPLAQLQKAVSQSEKLADSLLLQMQQKRLEKAVRSSLILALSELYEKLNVESPL